MKKKTQKMKAQLTFNLPEEQEEFETANNGWKYQSVLWDLNEFLRSKMKYDDKITDVQYDIYDEVRSKIWEFLNEKNITLN